MARNVGRYVAPIALVAVIVATVFVIGAGLDSTPHTAPAHADRAVLNVHAPPHRRFYVIRPGDTLSTISVKTSVSVAALETLNPSVDPNALQTGQRLRLRR
jgi:Tfp pilus assembly protein FimV